MKNTREVGPVPAPRMALALAMAMAMGGGLVTHATWTGVRQAWLSTDWAVHGRGAVEAAKPWHGMVIAPGEIGGGVAFPQGLVPRAGGWPDERRFAVEGGVVPNFECLVREPGGAGGLRMAAARVSVEVPAFIRGGGVLSPGCRLRLTAAVLSDGGVPERVDTRGARAPWDAEYTRTDPAAMDMDDAPGRRALPGVAFRSQMAMPASAIPGRLAAAVRG